MGSAFRWLWLQVPHEIDERNEGGYCSKMSGDLLGMNMAAKTNTLRHH